MNETLETMECPNHEGAFDCTPFCSVCEGEQEVTPRQVYRTIIAWDHPLGQEWQRLWASPFYSTAAQAEQLGFANLADYPYGSSVYLVIQDQGGRGIYKVTETE